VSRKNWYSRKTGVNAGFNDAKLRGGKGIVDNQRETSLTRRKEGQKKIAPLDLCKEKAITTTNTWRGRGVVRGIRDEREQGSLGRGKEEAKERPMFMSIPPFVVVAQRANRGS